MGGAVLNPDNERDERRDLAELDKDDADEARAERERWEYEGLAHAEVTMLVEGERWSR